MPFGARRTFGLVPVSRVEIQRRKDEDQAQSDFLDRDKIDRLSVAKQLRFYARKGCTHDIKRLIKIEAGGVVKCECDINAADVRSTDSATASTEI
jgi:hypothetical protein